jgi:hypothetical protein
MGSALVLLSLADVFLTVLYVRSGTSLISDRLARWAWRAFRAADRWVPDDCHRVMSYGGASILLLIIAVWVILLVVGFALITWPNLGTGVRSASGPTPHGPAAALYFAGANLATAGSGDLIPATPGMRLVAVVCPLIGMSVITLTLTYLLQVYQALMRRNTFALRLHFATRRTGDAAELIAGLGAGGNFAGARGDLGALARELVNLYESHHFFPMLLFFRFRDPHYALSRMTTITMDAATLIRSALDGEKYAPLRDCAASTTLWEGGTQLLQEMARVLLPQTCGRPGEPPDPATADRWRAHYRAAAARLREAGIRTAPDESAGAEQYVHLRSKWDVALRSFASYMDYAPAERDPAAAADDAQAKVV